VPSVVDMISRSTRFAVPDHGPSKSIPRQFPGISKSRVCSRMSVFAFSLWIRCEGEFFRRCSLYESISVFRFSRRCIRGCTCYTNLSEFVCVCPLSEFVYHCLTLEADGGKPLTSSSTQSKLKSLWRSLSLPNSGTIMQQPSKVNANNNGIGDMGLSIPKI
jgi:hypothetical protein